jgi:menaquinone-dependent protoporphyrinogen oxidase
MTANVLIVHASRFGSTQGIAERIALRLHEAGLAVTVAPADAAPDPADYDAVVVGSAVEAAKWRPAAVHFVRRHAVTLAERPVWLFSSGPVGARAAAAPQPDPRDLADLRELIGIRDHQVFGGAFHRATSNFDDMGLIERTLVRRFLPDGDWRDWQVIDAWAETIARDLVRTPVAAGTP